MWSDGAGGGKWWARCDEDASVRVQQGGCWARMGSEGEWEEVAQSKHTVHKIEREQEGLLGWAPWSSFTQGAAARRMGRGSGASMAPAALSVGVVSAACVHPPKPSL